MGRNFASFSVYVAIVYFDFPGAVDLNQPRLLPDGLLVTGGLTDRSIRNVVGTWSMHVVVDVFDPQRHKRGLLDAGGMVLHQLFGKATSADIQTSRHLIQQIRESNKQVLHKANELFSVINQTYNELSLHRTHLLDIEKSVTKLYAQVNTLQRVSAIRFERLRSSISIDRSLSLLESQQLFWHRQRVQYLKERDALEKGRLTESIMPIAELENIVQACHAKGFYVPRVEWLYEIIQIRPMWQSNDVLVYTASLPLTDNNEYLRYHLYTWPSVPNLANFTI